MYGWHRKPARHARQRIPFHMNIRRKFPGNNPGCAHEDASIAGRHDRLMPAAVALVRACCPSGKGVSGSGGVSDVPGRIDAKRQLRGRMFDFPGKHCFSEKPTW